MARTRVEQPSLSCIEATLEWLDMRIETYRADLARIRTLREQLARELTEVRAVKSEESSAAAKPDVEAQPSEPPAPATPAKTVPRHEPGGDPPAHLGDRWGNDGSPLMSRRRRQVLDYLKAHGASGTTKIAKALGIPTGSMAAILNHGWFTRLHGGKWEITSKDRKIISEH